MNTTTRLTLFGIALAAIFGAVFVTAKAVAPERTETNTADTAETVASQASSHAARGTAAADGVYQLGEISAPARTDAAGTLSFQITGTDGKPLTAYTESHEKLLHLIIVRSDGAYFRHVHPALRGDGVWSLPWTWEAAGTYRVFADFVPEGGETTTLTRTVDVAGEFTPVVQKPTTTASVGGYDVTLTGGLDSGRLTFEVTQGGEPVTALEPYLGAFGHLVALRQGDLAYLHVHPESTEPGPWLSFAASAPTTGRYLLYLDFKIDDEVHTAAFVVDATGNSTPATPSGGGHGGH